MNKLKLSEEAKLYKFIIVDWCYNHCWIKKEFDSFEDAWGFLFDIYPDDKIGSLDDYSVITIKEFKRIKK